MSTNNLRLQRKGLVFCSFLFLFLIGAPLTGFAQGNIAGQVNSDKPPAIFEVNILDATNAVLITTVATDVAGYYDSGPLPIGKYKVRFSALQYSSEYYGANDEDIFDLAAPVTVEADKTTVVNGLLKFTGPMLVCLTEIKFSGVVTDASNSMPLAGIEVSAVNAINAMPIGNTSTDPTGNYIFSLKDIPCGGVKVRFSDLTGSYLPQYFGATGQDIFAYGQLVNVDNVSAAMVKLTPSSAIDNLTNGINNSNLPMSTTTSMTGQLSRAKDIVNDSNPNNDVAACGILKSIINQINAAQNSGKLSTNEADTLLESANTARNTIGCK